MINTARLKEEFYQISRFGALDGGGITRLAFSEADLEARAFLLELLRTSKFDIRVDGIGNILAKIEGKNSALSPILVGSHLDSVPFGGLYDGTLGVMCALEAIRSIVESGERFLRPLELVVFSCEESSRFNMATIGSKVFCGKLDTSRLHEIKDFEGISVIKAAQKCGFDVKNIGKSKDTYHAYLELHIEQGPVLEQKGISVGAVSGIASAIRYELLLQGRADHSGATPMDMRKDALAAAAQIILAIEQIATFESKTTVATVGFINVVPGVLNVIPAKATLGIDIRDINALSLSSADAKICAQIAQITHKRGIKFTLKQLTKELPVRLDDEIIKMILKSCDKNGISCMQLPSGAGHDAMHMGELAGKVGMIFVPCKGGISHNVAEEIKFDEAVKGCEVLREVLLNLSNQE